MSDAAGLTTTRRFSLDNRVFVPVDNSTGGIVDTRTRFHFWQEGSAFYADYFGGDVHEGHIIGHFTSARTGQMLYHCMTVEKALKAGKANAQFHLSEDGCVSMLLNWEWISGGAESGQSRYEEITKDGWAL